MRSAGMLGLLVAAAMGEVAAVAKPLNVKKMNVQRTAPNTRTGRKLMQAKGATTEPAKPSNEIAARNARVEAERKARREKTA